MEENKKVIDAAQAPGGPSKATTSAEIRRKMDDLAFKIGVWSNGIDYFLENDAPQAVVDKYVQGMETLAINQIAEALRLTDEEKARLSDPETRTQKQKEAIFDTMRRIYGQLYLKYAESNFIHSFNIVVNVATEALGVSLELDDPETEPMLQALNMLNSYFYIEAHQGIDPLGNGDIGEAEETELRDLTKSYLAFHHAQDKEPTESVMDFMTPAMGDITALTAQSETTFLPISLIWRDQNNIARRGAAGALENVGKNTDAGTVYVEAYISDKDGNPLNINAVMRGVQSAVGQLIDENGRRLPIIVTPQQVYRAYARLANDTVVTKQQAAEMEKAMDALMFSPSRLDFTAQLEKHKKIKHQPDYDYKGKDAGRLTGNLIPMTKGEGTNRQGERQVAYKVYDYPVLYRYSHIVGQIAQVPNKLLTGDDKGAVKDKKTAEAQRNALNIGMRRVVLSRITYWRSRLKQHKPINSALLIHEIADDCNIELTEKVERTLKKNIQQYLDELKAQGTNKGGIRNYMLQKDGRHVVGFYVEF